MADKETRPAAVIVAAATWAAVLAVHYVYGSWRLALAFAAGAGAWQVLRTLASLFKPKALHPVVAAVVDLMRDVHTEGSGRGTLKVGGTVITFKSIGDHGSESMEIAHSGTSSSFTDEREIQAVRDAFAEQVHRNLQRKISDNAKPKGIKAMAKALDNNGGSK